MGGGGHWGAAGHEGAPRHQALGLRVLSCPSDLSPRGGQGRDLGSGPIFSTALGWCWGSSSPSCLRGHLSILPLPQNVSVNALSHFPKPQSRMETRHPLSWIAGGDGGGGHGWPVAGLWLGGRGSSRQHALLLQLIPHLGSQPHPSSSSKERSRSGHAALWIDPLPPRLEGPWVIGGVGTGDAGSLAP